MGNRHQPKSISDHRGFQRNHLFGTVLQGERNQPDEHDGFHLGEHRQRQTFGRADAFWQPSHQLAKLPGRSGVQSRWLRAHPEQRRLAAQQFQRLGDQRDAHQRHGQSGVVHSRRVKCHHQRQYFRQRFDVRGSDQGWRQHLDLDRQQQLHRADDRRWRHSANR